MLPFAWLLRARLTRGVAIGLVIFVSQLAFASSVLARSAGIEATGCDSCHRGGAVPTVMLTAEPMNAAVGQVITLTIGVSQTNGSTAGFYLTTAHDAPGKFEAFEAGTVASSSGVIHSMPRAGNAGITTFKARWTASQATGVAFDVYALSANGNKTNQGDGAGSAELELLVGCTGSTYFIDQDGDGYGSTDPAYGSRKDCATPLGYAEKPGDCDDFHADVHPDSVEQCDLKDNDCDGQVDGDVIDQPFCEDKDGDGHGAPSSAPKMDCKPSPGFAVCDNDCDDRAKTTHPGATEVCDGFDNDCDGKVDEGVRMVCGVGLCSRYASGCSSICTPGPPLTETCNGYDDDCDGAVDNGTNESLCADAKVACVAGRCDGTGSGGTASSGVSGHAGNDSSGNGAAPSAGGAGPGLGSPASSAASGCALGAAVPGSDAGPFAFALAGWVAARARARRRRAVPSRERLFTVLADERN